MAEAVDVAVYEHPARIQKTKKSIAAALKYIRTTSLSWRYVPFPGYDKPVPFLRSRAAIVYGAGTPNGEPHHVYNHRLHLAFRENGVLAVVLEMGYVDRRRYFSVGLNDIAGYGDYRMNLPTPRRPPRIRVCCQPRKRSDPDRFVLFCAQCPDDAQIRTPDYMGFVQKTLAEIRRNTRRRVVFRPHPRLDVGRHPRWADPAWVRGLRGVEVSGNARIEDDFARAHCVVAYNSNSLLDALVAGLPVFSFAPCMADRCSNKDLRNVDDPFFPSPAELDELLSDVTWSQWTLSEIAAGAPLRFMEDALRQKT